MTVFRLFALFCLLSAVTASTKNQDEPKDKDLRCSACELLAKRVEKELVDVDEKQTVLLGGRLEGGEARKKVKFARSEAHLMDIWEGVCDHLDGHYAVAKKGKNWKYIKDKDKNAYDEEEKFRKDVLKWAEEDRKAAEKAKEEENSPPKPAEEPPPPEPEEEEKEEVLTEEELAKEANFTEEEKSAAKELRKANRKAAKEEAKKKAEEEKQRKLDEEKRAAEQKIADRKAHDEKVKNPPRKTGFSKVLTKGEPNTRLKRQCRALVEQVEDDMTKYLNANWSEDLDIRNRVCVKLTRACQGIKKPKKKEAKEKDSSDASKPKDEL